MRTIATICFTFVAVATAQDLDLANLDELQKDERPVSPASLTTLILDADRLVVTESPLQDAKKLFESRERKDLDSLSKALVVVKPDEWFHCMCIGTPAIYLYKDDDLLVQISNHHGQAVRCSLWGSDAPISDTEKWLKWFDDRKIDGPRAEVDAMRESQEQSERNWKKWITAMPKGLEPVWEDSLGQFGDVDTDPLVKALNEAIPNENDQILALLRWFGSGSGPWTGHPSYESAAEKMLRGYDMTNIVAVIGGRKMTSDEIEGSARLLAMWEPATDLAKVPEKLKLLLWNHVSATKNAHKPAWTNEYRVDWARSAFTKSKDNKAEQDNRADR